MNTYWCGWEVDDSIPQEHMVERWPDGMKGWWSGSGGDDDTGYRTYAGRVDAETAEQAIQIIRTCYGPSSSRIRMRWEPEEKPYGYRATGGRFPE